MHSQIWPWGQKPCHYLFMTFTYISNYNTCIHILIYPLPVVPNDSEADLSNCVTSLNIHVQYIVSRLWDTTGSSSHLCPYIFFFFFFWQLKRAFSIHLDSYQTLFKRLHLLAKRQTISEKFAAFLNMVSCRKGRQGLKQWILLTTSYGSMCLFNF